MAQPSPGHRAAPQDKGTEPLEAPRYLFLPQSIKGPSKEHSNSTQCAKFTESGRQEGMPNPWSRTAMHDAQGPSPHCMPSPCSAPGPGGSAHLDCGTTPCYALCRASLPQSASVGLASEQLTPGGRTPKQAATKTEQHLGAGTPRGVLTQLWEAR